MALPASLHPYPDAVGFTQAWLDAAALIWGRADGGGTLLMFDWSALDFRPALAANLPSVSADNRVYTFTLRSDVRWSDGTPLSASDFQFAFDNASRVENHFAQIDVLQSIVSVRTPDPQTVEIALADARPRDVALSIANVLVPVPQHVWKGKSWTDANANTEIARPSVVLGPFALAERTQDARAVFAPVPTYYVGRPSVPRVGVAVSSGPAAALDAVSIGQANWLPNLPAQLYAQAVATPSLDVQTWTPANAPYRTIEFNTSRPLLGDRRVRQALGFAVHRSDLIAQAENGLAVPQLGFIQPTNDRWLNTSLSPYDLDLARARQLLIDAGCTLTEGQLKGPDGQHVRLQVVFPTSSGPRVRMASYLQAQYAQLGIAVDLKGLDFAAYTDTVSNRREFDVSLATYGGGSIDPDLGPKGQLMSNGPQNATGYANPQLDDIFRQAAQELDASRRKALYDQAQQIVNADMPSQYLYALKSIDVFSRRVHRGPPGRGDRADVNNAFLTWSVDQQG
ncbi:MAG: ABC transporter substrate-binding protein [Chloroflexota bacterium]